MVEPFEIEGRPVGPGHPVYIVAEMSANHLQERERAERIIQAAAEAGADAVKLATFRPDTITLNSNEDPFLIQGDTPWDGERLYDLYGETYMPWDWQPELQSLASELGLALFSTPADKSAVAFLESMDVPAYKLASFEIVDLPLIRCIASTGKPLIMSTGMATAEEIQEAVSTARNTGAEDIALLTCTSSYPAPPESMNLTTIPEIQRRFQVVPGLSDHSLDTAVPAAGAALGASIVEKHLTLSRDDGGPDAAFSLEPNEFQQMVDVVRTSRKAVGEPRFGPTSDEEANRKLRPSIWIVKEISAGERISEEHVDVLRPASGLHPRHLEQIIGQRVEESLEPGTPMSWEYVSSKEPT